MHTTYLFIIEIEGRGNGELEAALVDLAKRYPITWQAGPREFKVSRGTAAVAAMTKDNAPTATSPNDNPPQNKA